MPTSAIKKKMTLIDFLLHETQALELCAICEGGWVVATVWVDHEDLFASNVHPKLRERYVDCDKWDTLLTVNSKGEKVTVPCHYIYLEA